MKAGDSFQSLLSDRVVTVDSVAKGSVTFSVERRVVDKKTGELRLESRTRKVPREILPFFLNNYKPRP